MVGVGRAVLVTTHVSGLDCVPGVPLHPSSEREEMGVSGAQT